MKNGSLSSRVSRLTSFVDAASCRVILPLVLALAALPALARYVPANWTSLPTLAGGKGETLAAGEYRVTSDITYSEQLAIADNATVTLWFKYNATLTADLSAKTTGQAGIKLPPTSTLILRSADGTGALVAKGAQGAKAADGEDGVTVGDWSEVFANGGNGGAGATGGGAGIGGNGGAGGASGYRGDAGKTLRRGSPERAAVGPRLARTVDGFSSLMA